MIRILSTFDKKTPPIIISYIDSGRSISTYCEVFKMEKYTDARYPEKINDLIDNEGGLSEEGKTTINESVKEAIEGGDIPVPAGGTKLYRHKIGASFPLSAYIILITQQSTPYSSLPEIKGDELFGGISYGPTSLWNILYIKNSNVCGINDQGQIVIKTFSEMGYDTISGDTVTEL